MVAVSCTEPYDDTQIRQEIADLYEKVSKLEEKLNSEVTALKALIDEKTVVASATQDIVLDAYRIESFNNREQGAGVAVFVLGYRIGTIFSGAGALFLAAVMSWEDVYKIMTLGAVVGMVTILLSKEPKKLKEKSAKKKKENLWKREYNI